MRHDVIALRISSCRARVGQAGNPARQRVRAPSRADFRKFFRNFFRPEFVGVHVARSRRDNAKTLALQGFSAIALYDDRTTPQFPSKSRDATRRWKCLT